MSERARGCVSKEQESVSRESKRSPTLAIDIMRLLLMSEFIAISCASLFRNSLPQYLLNKNHQSEKKRVNGYHLFHISLCLPLWLMSTLMGSTQCGFEIVEPFSTLKILLLFYDQIAADCEYCDWILHQFG